MGKKLTAAALAAAIKPVPNEFDDHFLDVVGNEFKFDHAKGLAEWIKNSADAYATTAKVKDAEQFILLRFKQGQPKRESVFECVDFVGMTKRDIDKALKVWGLATAAKKGTDLPTYGGHGNGGKFYMRQMFQRSRFITYRGGLLNVFGFDEHRRYGYAKGLENAEMTLEEALTFAEMDVLDIPQGVRARWKSSARNAGFTVVRGENPERFSGRSTIASILDRLRLHPQARRVLAHKQVIALGYGQPWGRRLEPPTVAAKEGFEKPREIQLPRAFELNGEMFALRTKKYPDGKLILRTSEMPLTRSSDLAALNTIDVMGEIGCIASYRMNELGFLRYAPEAEFIYGECECPLLEDPEHDSVRNDREKLVENDLTHALLEWIRRQVDELAEQLAEKRRAEKKSRDLRQSSLFNQLLDKWKNRFMVKLTAELFGGSAIGDSFGGIGGGGEKNAGKDRETKSRGDGNSVGEKEGGGGAGDEKRRGPRFPRVLLSGHDLDPLDESAAQPFECDPRHPPVYQRDVDIANGIYWINTSRPLASKLMDRYGASHARWREYLFQRYVDIILKQTVHELGKRDPEFTPDKVDGLIDDVTSRVHDAAADDLEQFLFEESLTGAVAPAAEPEADVAAE